MQRNERFGIAILLLASFAVHCIVAQSSFGFEVDMKDFAIWGKRMAELGPALFYSPSYWCDYPPSYLVVSGMLQQLIDALSLQWGSKGWLIVMKMPAALCDCATGWLIWLVTRRALRRSTATEQRGLAHAGCSRRAFLYPLLAAACYLFNPAVLLDSSLWGQVDGILAFFLAATFSCYLHASASLAPRIERTQVLPDSPKTGETRIPHPEKRLKPATACILGMAAGSILWSVGLTFKLQGIVVAPAVLVAFLLVIAEDRRTGLIALVISILAAFIAAAFVVIPFTTEYGLAAFLQNLLDSLGSYEYASVNALNFFTMVGAGWASQDLPFLGLTYKNWGTIFLVMLVAFVFACYIRSEWTARKLTTPSCARPRAQGPALPILLAAVLVLGFFTFSVRVHERYAFCAIALLLIATVLYRDNILFAIFAATSALQFANMLVVFNGAYLHGNVPAEVAGSAVAVALCLALFIRTWQLAGRRHPNPKNRKPLP